MFKKIVLAGLLFIAFPLCAAENMPLNNAILFYQSPYSVAQTVDKITQNLAKKGIKIFARINFSADAKKAGLNLPDEELLIFGNPKAGTHLLQENPLMGLDLPLKILVWRTASGETQIAYQKPSILAKRYAITKSTAVAAQMDALLVYAIQN